jgi:hypothetical protein
VKDPYGCDLLDKLLQLDPAKRLDTLYFYKTLFETPCNHILAPKYEEARPQLNWEEGRRKIEHVYHT